MDLNPAGGSSAEAEDASAIINRKMRGFMAGRMFVKAWAAGFFLPEILRAARSLTGEIFVQMAIRPTPRAVVVDSTRSAGNEYSKAGERG
jgi:hypothetical protein